MALVTYDAILELRVAVSGEDGTRGLVGDWSPRARHWGVWIDDQAVGCASVMAVRGHVLRGMAVRQDHQRRGVGTVLLETVSAEVAGPMWCNARIDAVPFYLRRGWILAGPPFEMDTVGPARRMLWQPEP